jgi:NADH-quinone oxidoreductase subunit G
MRVVPRENETINETWLSDRDRFSYTGLMADDRLTTPLIRETNVDGCLSTHTDGWREVSWQEALAFVTSRLQAIISKHGASQ